MSALWIVAAIVAMLAGMLARGRTEDAQAGFLRGLVTGLIVAALLFKAVA